MSGLRPLPFISIAAAQAQVAVVSTPDSCRKPVTQPPNDVSATFPSILSLAGTVTQSTPAQNPAMAS